MAARIRATLAGLILAGSASGISGQEPVITVSTVQSSIAENPNQVTRTTTTTSLSTTTTSSATFAVRSDRILRTNLTVQYQVSGTAVAGKDYQALSGSVTIPAGTTTASITVVPINDSEDEIDETVVVTILAPTSAPYTTTRPFAAGTSIVDDDNVRIIGLAMSPDTVLGGLTRDLRITVSGAAPPGGLVVSVASGNSGVVANTQATIAAGTRVAVARLTTRAVASSIPVPLTVTEPFGSSARDTLVVLGEPAVQTVSYRFWDNFGGRDFHGSVYLDGPAPPGGLTVPVTLTLLSPAGAPLPASAPATVSVAAGSYSAALLVTSQPVNTLTRVEVRAATGGGAAADTLEIYPYPQITSMTASPDPIRGTDSVEVRLQLDQPVGPRLGFDLYFRGNGPVQVAAPQRLWVQIGQQQATVRFKTDAVANPTAATLNASRDQTQSGPWNTRFTVDPPAVRLVNYRFWDNFGGTQFHGSVYLDKPAPAAGLTVPVTYTVVSPAGAALPVSGPSSVSVAGGGSVASLVVSSQAVSSLTRVEVRAGTPSGTAADTLDIYPLPKVQSLTVSPDPAASMDSADIRIQLDQVVGPRVGFDLYLSGSGPVRLSPFTRLWIRTGNREGTLRVGTDAVTAPATATVNGSTNRTSPGPWNTTFTVAPVAPLPSVSVVAFNNATVTGGTSVPVTLVLTGPVPAGRSLTVNVTATDPVIQPANPVVTIPEGQATGTITVQTRTVTQLTQGTLRADVQGGGSVTGTVAVQPVPVTLDGFTLSPARVFGGNSATPVTGTLTLSAAAPAGGLVAGLRSSDPAAASVPATVTVPAGANSATFPIQTTIVVLPIDVRVTATLGTQQLQQTLRVESAVPQLASIAFNPATVDAGANTTGRVDLVAAAVIPTPVALTASNPNAVAVPASVTIPAGQSGVSFQLTGGAVSVSTLVQVSAALASGQVSANVTVQPAAAPITVTAVTANPASVIGGADLLLTVTLSRPADPGGLTVNISSNAPGVVPSSMVQIGSGQTTGAVTVRTAAVGTDGQVRMTVGPSSTGTDVRILPLPLDRIQSAGSIRAGDEVDFEIRLQQPAPAGGLRVPLLSNLPNVIPLPGFVDIPAGAMTATVTVRSRPVPTEREVTVSAGVAPASASRTVRVRS